MEEGNKTLLFLTYINKKLTSESMQLLYDANNITREKCELYSDFIQSLILIIFDTYMGDDVTSATEQINHFKWCWDKNVSNFKEEGFTINSEKLYSYFLEFMHEVYYPLPNKIENNNTYTNLLKLWMFIFDFDEPKTKSDVDTLIEVYGLMSASK
jgi:HSP90 family molecular chaperone